MFYDEKLKPVARVPMDVNVMGQEDRTGRGGDHIPFRERGYRNLRFTSANEHGNGSPDANYTDRQHTVHDILGIDTDGDQQIDSFFVDFNYLARNTVINASSASLLAQGPAIPEFILHNETTGLRVEVVNPGGAIEYRVGVRDGSTPEFDQFYSFTGTSFLVPDQVAGQFYYISVSAIDSSGIMSPFTTEERAFSQANTSTGTPAMLSYPVNCQQFGVIDFPGPSVYRNINLLSSSPNPFKENTEFIIEANELTSEEVMLVVANQSGRIVAEIPVNLNYGRNQVPFKYDGPAGFLVVSLKIGERIIESRKIMAR